MVDLAHISGLSKDARRTEILRAKGFTELTDRVTDLETDTTPTAWTAVTFQNSWANFTTGSTHQPAQYRRVGDLVYVRGEVLGGASASVAFTLPVGFRPPKNLDTPAVQYDTGTTPNHSMCNFYVQSSGECMIYWYTTTAPDVIGFNIQFSVTA